MYFGTCIVCGEGIPGSDVCHQTQKCKEITERIEYLNLQLNSKRYERDSISNVISHLHQQYALHKKLDTELLEELWKLVNPNSNMTSTEYITKESAYIFAAASARDLFWEEGKRRHRPPRDFIDRLKELHRHLVWIDKCEGFDKDPRYDSYYPLSPEQVVERIKNNEE